MGVRQCDRVPRAACRAVDQPYHALLPVPAPPVAHLPCLRRLMIMTADSVWQITPSLDGHAPWAPLPHSPIPTVTCEPPSTSGPLMTCHRTHPALRRVQIIPDIDSRVVVSAVGTPATHARFLRRKRGAYGPANLLTMSGALPQAVKPLANVFCCGDSVFPGAGTPAVAANGMWVANTLVPVAAHTKMLDDIGV